MWRETFPHHAHSQTVPRQLSNAHLRGDATDAGQNITWSVVMLTAAALPRRWLARLIVQ